MNESRQKKNTMVIFLVIAFVSCLPAVFCSADDALGVLILKDIRAQLIQDNIELKIELDNLANTYIKATPEITIYRNNNILINKALGQYILLPNRTNIITVQYSKSFFGEGNYTIESKLGYDKKESNTVLKLLSISSDWQISMENAKETIVPSDNPLESDNNTNQMPYIAIVAALSGAVLVFLFLKGFKYSKTNNNTGVDNNNAQTLIEPASIENANHDEDTENKYVEQGKSESAGGVSTEGISPEPVSCENAKCAVNADVESGSRESTKDDNETHETSNEAEKNMKAECDNMSEESAVSKETGKDNENTDAGKVENDRKMARILGKDVMMAINEEKERLGEEINDLERLHKKGILDADIFDKNKKLVENKLEHISIESVLSSKRSTEDVKEDVVEKLKQREEKIINSISMLDKLYSDDVIDEKTYQKNKNDLKSALDKLKNVG